MMRHCGRLRLVSPRPVARIAATILLSVVALAVLASPALAVTTHRRPEVPRQSLTPASAPGLSRHVIMQAAMGGAVVMSLLTTSVLVFGRVRKPVARRKPKPFLPAGPDHGRRSSDDHYVSALPYFPEYDDSGAEDPAADPEPTAPSWLGLVGPQESPDPPAASTAVNLPPSSDEEPTWPDFLALASDTEQATAASYACEPHDGRLGTEPLDTPHSAGTPDAPRENDPYDHAGLAESGFSPAALRVLGARPLRERGEYDMPPQRYQVALGDDRIEVLLTDAPAVGQASRPRAGNTWLAATPYLLWAPLPYDVPDDGLAFACVGAGDEGCLFIDLGAAPGAVAIDGDTHATLRLAESIAHQLCARAAADHTFSVLSVGRAIPEPHPASARLVPTLRDLAEASLDSPPDSTDIVFCELRTNEDAFVLARHVRSSLHRVVPVVLGHLPGAAWSFTAHPGYRPDGALPPLVSSLAGMLSP